ncbi:MAG: DUF2254 domain-containing protein [Kofleriaceae bacterium]|nr:DUF2254 domain-containing protein [Kofleriaceae bacterium]MBP9172766.1 DUF2254 domain-containing protein [Kofleriaceae bacterium]MBP9862381.1 DUF2254 domain-containing protein [Kofleriaceae bacterium]
MNRRLWLWPVALLAAVALALFAGFYLADADGGVGGYFAFESDMITDALPSMAAMIAAVLGIVITVVSIIVQLSSERYTGVAQMFLRDRVNVLVMAYFVVACVCGVWLSVSVKSSFVPRTAIVAMLAFTTLGLVVMLPYFAYVFRFLEPSHIVARIREEAVATVERATATRDDAAAIAIQGEVLAAMEELTDITSNSISGKDKIIASRAVDAIKDFVVGYLGHKGSARAPWFAIGPTIRDNPDFVAMDPESLRDLEARRTWVEWKALRQYLGIYNEAGGAMPDINYLIAIDTRYIGEAAATRGDREVVRLVFRFMNSYLRATINAKAVRTAYNVLNQYRQFVEAMIRRGEHEIAAEAVGHMIYYGRTSYDLQLDFVTETVAYDVGTLCELAHGLGGGDALLAQFLELDQPLRGRRQEGGLIGIRKAQVKLACFYLAAGAEAAARRIADDMRAEPSERLRAIREQLERVESKDFWEIIDRGRNFEYMPEAQRRQMATFFGWLAEAPAGVA